MTLRLLHLEDNRDDVELVRTTLARAGLACEVLAVDTAPAYRAALQQSHFDAVLSDSRVLGYDGRDAMSDARARFPGIPFIVVSAAGNSTNEQPSTAASAITACVPKSELQSLAPTIRQALSKATVPAPATTEVAAHGGLQRLLSIIQRLSLARDLSSIMDIVRREARAMAHADGASFVLREGNLCFYAEEDAIAPLWKGQRFPMEACVSGWTMLNNQAAIIEDIDLDARVPPDAYRPTFVKSLVVTPIRGAAPIGAIGVYWATRHRATQQEIEFLQALADSTSVAIEAAEVFANLERTVAERTAEADRRNTELEVLNKEIEAFSYAVAHDLRSPLITIDGFAQVLHENIAHRIDETNREHLTRISTATRRMHQLINDMLALSKIVRAPLHMHSVDLSRLAKEILRTLRESAPPRPTECVIAEGLTANGDPGLLRIVLENLLANAWKFTARQELTRIQFESGIDRAGRPVYYIRDNGAGFDPRYAAKLFGPFQRLHAQTQFPGTGIGLATVQRIIHRHGGEIWAESAVDCGATFYFTLPR
jgi:signal transduction histidine kinase/DNA-binding NarL/FixJ family response regulator